MIAQLVERETVVVKTVEISRSAVRLRLAGAVDIFRHWMQQGKGIPFLHCSQKVVLMISEKWPISGHSFEVKERSDWLQIRPAAWTKDPEAISFRTSTRKCRKRAETALNAQTSKLILGQISQMV